MLSCYKLWFSFFIVISLENHQTWSKPLAKTATEPTITDSENDSLKLITHDVIDDKIEMSTKKVIRVNPQDLLPLRDDPHSIQTDSSLYKIQTLKTINGERKYINIKRSNPVNVATAPAFKGLTLLQAKDKTAKIKHQPKKKKLHFLYNQEDYAGNLLSKSMPVHVAPGAYPVYYVVAKTNGRFGKHPIKSFSTAEAFMKYLEKKKLEQLPALRDIKGKEKV